MEGTLFYLLILLGLMGGIAMSCAWEVSLAQVSCILYMTLSTLVGAQFMALVLGQCITSYVYICVKNTFEHTLLEVPGVSLNRRVSVCARIAFTFITAKSKISPYVPHTRW